MADVTTRRPGDLTLEEHEAFRAVCPHAQFIHFSQELAPNDAVPGMAFVLGVGVQFDDGRQHGLRSRVSAGTAEDRAHPLRTAAVKLRDWYDGKAAS